VPAMALGSARLPALGLLLARIRPATNALARPRGSSRTRLMCAAASAPE
jgi:hypothetical protein